VFIGLDDSAAEGIHSTLQVLRRRRDGNHAHRLVLSILVPHEFQQQSLESLELRRKFSVDLVDALLWRDIAQYVDHVVGALPGFEACSVERRRRRFCSAVARKHRGSGARHTVM
jgi:hypothetical protein